MNVGRSHTTKYGIPQTRLQPSAPGFILTAGDREILRLVFTHRFLRRDHLSALTGRHPKRLHRRLHAMEKNGYLSVVRLPQQQYLYGLGKEAIPVLVGEGVAPPSLLGQRLRTSELKPLFLKHETMIVDIHVALALASRRSTAKLLDWREGRELHDSVVIHGRKRLPVRPDAFFGVEDSRCHNEGKRAYFALEADRSTATQTRFEDKIRAYWNYIEQGLHAARFGVKGFRVLTVTLTDSRAKNLCELAREVVPDKARKYFLFVSLPAFTDTATDPLCGSICHAPRAGSSEQRYPLVATPATLHKNSSVV